MAYPYQITTAATARMPHPHYDMGPFVYGTSIVLMLHDQTNDTVEAWLSTDLGVTWAETDSGNHPQAEAGSLLDNYGALGHRRGDIVHVGYVAVGGATSSITQFDLTSMTWGSTVTGGPAEMNALAVRSNGDIVVMYITTVVLSAINCSRIDVTVYNGSTWDSGQPVFIPGTTDPDWVSAPNNSYFPWGLVVDSNDRTHILAQTYAFQSFDSATTTGYRYRSLSSSNVLDDGRKIEAPVARLGGRFGPPRIVTLCGVETIVAPCTLRKLRIGATSATNPDVSRHAVLLFEAMANPGSFRLEMIDDDTLNDDFTIYHYPLPSLVVIGSTYYLYYNQLTPPNGGTPQLELRRVCWNGASWSAPTTVYTPPAGFQYRFFASAAVIGSDVGILLQKWLREFSGPATFENPHFYLDVAPSCTATSGCSGGSTATNMNQII